MLPPSFLLFCLLLAFQRDGEIFLLARGEHSLDVKNGFLARRGVLHCFLQIVDSAHHFVVHTLDDETFHHTGILQCAVVHLQHFQTIVDAQLALFGLVQLLETGSQHIQIGGLNYTCIALGVLQRHGLLLALLVVEVDYANLVTGTFAGQYLLQLGHLGHGLAVQRDNHVAFYQAGIGSGTALAHLGYIYTVVGA